MDMRDFKRNLITEITETIFPSGYKNHELGVRCPFCGDSRKDPTHYHLNIRINPDDDYPLVFRCLRCNTSGLLNSELLAMIGASSSEYGVELKRYNRLSCKKNGIVINKKGIDLKIPKVEITDKVRQKHKYIENRLGLELSIEELSNKKIVYDFIGLMKYNKINKLTTTKDKIISLQNDHVGFLSAKNEFINFRNILDDKNRYYIYKIRQSIDTTGKFYIMPNKVNPFSEKSITINIAEGVFDILGIYYHLFDKQEDNIIYSAINGAGYMNVLKYIISCGILCNVNINIFSDADREPSYYDRMIEQILPFVNNIRLFYNDIGKDYGVPKNKIKLKEVKIS